MIVYLSGKIIKYGGDFVDLLCDNGIGYRVYVIKRELSGQINIGDKLDFHIYHYIREDKELLYGFINQINLQVFEELIKLSGVGPSIAIAILDTLGYERLVQSIRDADIAMLTQVSGVGKKMAKRILNELENSNWVQSFYVSSDKNHLDNKLLKDLKEGLLSLGFNHGEVFKVVSQLEENDIKNKKLDELLVICLSKLQNERNR